MFVQSVSSKLIRESRWTSFEASHYLGRIERLEDELWRAEIQLKKAASKVDRLTRDLSAERQKREELLNQGLIK